MEFTSRPLTCRGFSATLDIFGFSSDDPGELSNLAAELASAGESMFTVSDSDGYQSREPRTHPVFEAMLIHINQCDHCLGISDPVVSERVKNPRFGRVT